MPTSPRRVLALLLALGMLVAGCGGWRAIPLPDRGRVEPRQQFQVFHGRRVEQWHALRVSADSVSGVPFIKDPGCDSCRVAVPRAAVDSVRYGDPPDQLLGLVGGVILAGLLALALACGSGGCLMN